DPQLDLSQPRREDQFESRGSKKNPAQVPMMIRSLVSAVAFAALAACSSDPMRDIRDLFQPAKAEATFTTGLKQYENGEYAESAKNLQSALDKGLGDRDKIGRASCRERGRS